MRFITCLIILCVLFFSNCSGVDKYIVDNDPLESESEPKVFFNCDLINSEGNMLLLLGIYDPTIFTGPGSYKDINFFLKNNNPGVRVKGKISGSETTYLGFRNIPYENLVKLRHLFNNFDIDYKPGMYVFGIYLEKMSVKNNNLMMYKTLDDGEHTDFPLQYVHILPERNIFILEEELNDKLRPDVEDLIGNTFLLTGAN